MNRRKKRPNYFAWTIFGLIVLFGYYVDQVYLTQVQNPFLETPTATRSAEAYASEADNLFKIGKLFQAIDAYKEAIRSSPQDSTLYVALARIQVWAGQYAEAQNNAESALLLNPKNALAQGVRAWALDFQGRNAEAMDAIEQAVAADPNNALIQAYYVEILTDAGFENYPKAAEHSLTALALDPGIVETHRARAYIYNATTGNEQATVELNEAIKINKYIPILHMELGHNYRILQATDKAVTEYTLANTLNPSDPNPEFWISYTYAGVGDYAKAVQYAEQAVKDDPVSAKLRGNYGVLLNRNLRWPEAVDQLRLAVYGGKTEDGQDIVGLQLSTTDSLAIQYYYTYGLALSRLNQCGEALQIVQNLQSKVRSNDDAMAAADKTIEICQENLSNPVASTATPEPSSTPAVDGSATSLPN